MRAAAGKTCVRCGADDWYSGGRACASCDRARANTPEGKERERNRVVPEQRRAASQRYREKHPERARADNATFRRKNPTYHRDWELRKKYGITYEQYEEMVKRQNGVCAICARADPKRRLSVDHDHTTGKVRGLLCQTCNMAIGKLGDSAERLRVAADYLERYA